MKKKGAGFFLIAAFLLSQSGPLFADHVKDEILIQWKAASQVSPWIVPGTGVTLTRHCRMRTLGWEHWELPDGMEVNSILSAIRAHPDIQNAEPNYIRHTMGRVPNDPLTLNQKHLDLINAYAGWEFDVGASSAVTIAIIDTGVDITHPDLSSMTAKIWRNPLETAGNAVDDDGNGRADDINGWNFGDNNNNVSDCLGHGTLVASIAGASSDNGKGVAGVSWGAKILPLKVFPNASCDSATSAAIASAIEYAVWAATSATHTGYTGRTVINMSLGCQESISCPASVLEQNAINLAVNNGVVVVAAKGNFGSGVTVYPSDYPGVIGVGATTSKDTLTSFSSFGSSTDIVAPGADVFGAARGGGYRDDDGTSFSAPQIAGAAALIFSALPTATTTQVEQFLYLGADDLGPSGRDNQFGHGRLNLLNTMRRVRFGNAVSFDGLVKAIAVPNPMRAGSGSRTTFTFPNGISGGPNPKFVVYDISGMTIRENEGFSWDGKNNGGASVAPGVYIFEVKTDRGRARGRVIIE